MVKAKVVKIEGDKVVLGLVDGQSLVLPAESIEGECKLGQDVSVVAAVLGSEDAGRQRIAHHILNELLKG
ncbi:hypothetical protein HZC53_04615 [Candidatus Uhrbacteria bacterium]|nr:hypothetical protein [Candidatus Uhrbacteria bacterium]